jgi:hypothetical protein
MAKKIRPEDTIWFTHMVAPTEKAAKNLVRSYNTGARAYNTGKKLVPGGGLLPDLPAPMKANFKKGGVTRGKPPKRGRR